MGLALPFSSSTAAYLLLPPISIHLKRLPARCVESNLQWGEGVVRRAQLFLVSDRCGPPQEYNKTEEA